ncbi:hypothetical protein MAM1_0061c03817 [Mucor ambiguus]|uniref:Uncharacterized protein n=1 Tax=Mucor ambiguus TaxID=91626 RepID=A0A0C9MMJ3_9FUNG|nr:hypothetical protein MAM1_0061c03817 [Mucor ambiguus]
MPTKPVDSRKLKSGGAAGPSGSKGKRTEKKKTVSPFPYDSPSYGIQDAQRAHAKRSNKKPLRRLLSLSLVSYLGYSFFYACGSPFDETSDKPAVCEAIDPIKLDLYKVYQSDYYQSNIDPHVAPIVSKISGLYDDYGVHAQVKVMSLYDQHGKPLVNKGYQQASHVYAQYVEPKVCPLVAKSKIHADHVKIQLQPYYQQASKQATQAQLFAKQQWDNLPPQVKQAGNKVLEYYHRAENTDMLPILTEAYWRIVDFYQYQFIPFIQTHPTTAHVNKFYDENIRSFVETNVKPLLLLVKNHTTHVNQLLNHVLTLLPQRSLGNEPLKSTVASSIVETKTPIIDATKVVSDIPLTTTAAAATTVTVTPATTKTIKSEAQAPSSAEPASSAVPTKEKAESTPAKQASTTPVSIATTTIATGSIKTEATVAKDAVNNDQDIVKPVSVRPTTTPEYVEMEVESPQADKKEAVYCPTCNAAEEQVIVAPTDKHIVPVRDEKEVFEIHTDKDVFEVNKEPVIVPPQTPAHLDQEEDVNAAAPIKQDASNVEDQTAPIKKEEDKKEEEEEEQVFSTQVEHDVEDDGFPEPAVPLQEDDEEEEKNEKVKETPVVTAVVDKQQVEIPLPVVTEKEKIAVPNDESEYEESKDQIVIQAPAAHQEEPVVKKEAIDVEPILKEPIVPNDESKFEAKSEFSNQDADPPVRYYRVEKALSQCPY